MIYEIAEYTVDGYIYAYAVTVRRSINAPAAIVAEFRANDAEGYYPKSEAENLRHHLEARAAR